MIFSGSSSVFSLLFLPSFDDESLDLLTLTADVLVVVVVSSDLLLVGFLNLCLPGVRSFKSVSNKIVRQLNHKLNEWPKVN